MQIRDWKLDDLIEHLKLLRSSTDFDYRCVTRVFGELHIYNGEYKDGKPEDNIF